MTDSASRQNIQQLHSYLTTQTTQKNRLNETDLGKQCKTRSKTPQNAVSDQVLHCLLIEVSFEIEIKMKNTTQQP